MKIQFVDIKKIKTTSYNPTTRLNNISGLAASIEKHGLIYPLILTKEMRLVDGNRRLAALKLLGWKLVPYRTMPKGGLADELYATLGATARRLTSFENLYVYLTRPSAVTEKARAKFELMEDVCGRPLLKRMVKHRAAGVCFDTARAVCRYIGIEDQKYISKVIRWFLKHGMQFTARRAMIEGVAPVNLRKVIDSNRPMRVRVG